MPALSAAKARGTTKNISNRFETRPTDFIPHAIPFIETVKRFSSMGSVKLRCSEPTAVLDLTRRALGDATWTEANIPGERPRTELGVTGVGDAVGVGEGVGVAVGLGVGVGEAVTANRLAPVAKLKVAACSCVVVGVKR